MVKKKTVIVEEPIIEIEKEMNIVFESYSDKLKTTEKELNDWINSIEK